MSLEEERLRLSKEFTKERDKLEFIIISLTILRDISL